MDLQLANVGATPLRRWCRILDLQLANVGATPLRRWCRILDLQLMFVFSLWWPQCWRDPSEEVVQDFGPSTCQCWRDPSEEVVQDFGPSTYFCFLTVVHIPHLFHIVPRPLELPLCWKVCHLLNVRFPLGVKTRHAEVPFRTPHARIQTARSPGRLSFVHARCGGFHAGRIAAMADRLTIENESPWECPLQDQGGGPPASTHYFTRGKGTDFWTHLHLSHSKNLESLPMSDHFPCARPYALLTRPSLLLTQSKLATCLREMLTQSYATQGIAYAESDMTRSLLKM